MNTESPATPTQRIHSRDPEHLRDDLAASLDFALGSEASDTDRAQAATIVDSVKEHRDAQSSLREVLAVFGPAFFGNVALFHFEAQTSMMGYVEPLTHPRSLAERGYDVRDLGWSADVLSMKYLDQAVEDPDRDARLAEAVLAWKAAHLPEAGPANAG